MKRKWPRSVRGAKRRGWIVVEPKYDPCRDGNPSYMVLQDWVSKQSKGRTVSSFLGSPKFAFESEKDAAWFSLKWT